MAGFFSNIQGYFSATFGGRYVALILRELIREDPKFAKILFKNASKNWVAETEYRFDAKSSQSRFADLVLFDKSDADCGIQPAALVEVKYDDQASPTNAAQLDDYLEFSSSKGIPFLYLTQYTPPRNILERINESNNSRHLLYTELAERITGSQRPGGVAKLFVDYLEDRGLVMKPIQERDLSRLLVRAFNPQRGGKKNQSNEGMIVGIPDTLSALMSNTNIVAQGIAEKLPLQRSPTIDMYFDPWIYVNKKDLRGLSNEVKGDEREPLQIVDGMKGGGSLWVFGRVYPGGSTRNEWLWLKFGCECEISRDDPKVSVRLFARCGTNKVKDIPDAIKEVKISTLSDRSKYAQCIISRASECLRNLNKSQNLSDKQRKDLRESLRALSGTTGD